MTKKQKEQYKSVEELKEILNLLRGKKFRLDCGHHVTFGFYLGNNIFIQNGKQLEVICSLCAY